MFEVEIQRGAELLDREVPGWELLIDVGKLDLANCEVCILGQAFGDFLGACDSLGLDYMEKDEPADCGFDTAYSYATLTDEWGAFIKARLDAGIDLSQDQSDH